MDNPEALAILKGQPRMDNPETLAILKGQPRMDNPETLAILKGQPRMENPETLAILGTQDTGRRQTKYKNTTQHRKLKKGLQIRKLIILFKITTPL